jgi:hypothetical protein
MGSAYGAGSAPADAYFLRGSRRCHAVLAVANEPWPRQPHIPQRPAELLANVVNLFGRQSG